MSAICGCCGFIYVVGPTGLLGDAYRLYKAARPRCNTALVTIPLHLD